MRVLVTYATQRGSTAELAAAIAEGIRSQGWPVDLLPVRSVEDIAPYDAVVLGSAIYFDRWRSEALRFAHRNSIALLDREVWLFDSGPLDGSADEGHARSAHGIDLLAERLGARGHMTFGGNLNRASTGPVVRRVMDRGKAGTFGDHRNLPRAEQWGREIGRRIGAHVRPEAVAVATD